MCLTRDFWIKRPQVTPQPGDSSLRQEANPKADRMSHLGRIKGLISGLTLDH